MEYKENIFTKFIEDNSLIDVIFKSDNVLGFKDINPLAANHILCIPTGKYIDLPDFIVNSTMREKQEMLSSVHSISNNLSKESTIYMVNVGSLCGQEVFHFHMHVINPIKLEDIPVNHNLQLYKSIPIGDLSYVFDRLLDLKILRNYKLIIHYHNEFIANIFTIKY